MDETTARPRPDAWYAPLSETERWAVYEKALALPWSSDPEAWQAVNYWKIFGLLV